jgi:hypothetical protein
MMSGSVNKLGCVDSNLKTFGIECLRVADMSICPLIPKLVPPKQPKTFDGINLLIAGTHKLLHVLLDKLLQKRFAWNINLTFLSSQFILDYTLSTRSLNT